MKYALFVVALLCSSMASAKYLCSYDAYITDEDRFNSTGKSLVTGSNKSSAVAIIQQDRANFYNGVDDVGDVDCYFDERSHRNTVTRKLNRGNISGATINKIVTTGGWFTVEVYTDHINVRPADR